MSDKELAAGNKEHESGSPANGFLAFWLAGFLAPKAASPTMRGVFTFLAYAMIIKTQHARRDGKYK